MRLRHAVPALAVILVAGCGGASGASHDTVTVTKTPTGPKTFSASGHIDVDGSTYRYASAPRASCNVDEGYDDIARGAQVVVSAPSGKMLAIGRLGPSDRENSYTCRFAFTIHGIPEGYPLYSVEVSHRGKLTYTEAEMKSGLAFTLGD